jgi:hypothetical protein
MTEINKLLSKKPFVRQAAPVNRVIKKATLKDTNTYSEATIPERNVVIMTQAEFLAEYDPRGHKIYNTAIYPDKTILDNDGKFVGTEFVARVALALQKMIALKQAVHLIGNPPKLTAALGVDSALFIKYKEYRRLKGIQNAMYLGVKSALETGDGAIWFYKDKNSRLKWKVWSYRDGDTLIPTYEKGILTTMVRRYWSMQDGQTVDTIDVVTNRTYSTYTKKVAGSKTIATRVLEGIGLQDKEWDLVSSAAHGFSQVPVAYQRNEDVAWGDGQELIDMIERTLSDLRESDAYFALGILSLTGDIEVLPSKGHQGKVISGEDGSDAKLLEQSDVSQGFKFELETYFERLFDITGTVVIRHADLKGGDITGAAIRNYYNPAIQYAMDKAPNYYDFLNQIEAITIDAMGMEYGISSQVKGMEVISEIDIYVPANTLEVAQKIQYMVQAGVLSKETAQEVGEYSSPDEKDRLEREAAKAAALLIKPNIDG